MITRRFSILNSRTIGYFIRFRHLGVCSYCMAAASSNFMLGQRDFQMLSLRKLSSGASVSSSIDIRNGRFIANGFRLRACYSENYRNVLGSNGDFRIDRGGKDDAQKERVYAPFVPGVQRVSDELVKVENQQASVGSYVVNGSCSIAHKGNYRGVWDQSLPEKIMVAVDVDEGIRFS